MRAKVINLRRARKGRARDDRRAKVAKRIDAQPSPADAKLEAARHEGHRLVPTPDPKPDAD